jgi:hypothetical protein
MAIPTENRFLVARAASGITALRMHMPPLTAEDAMNLAAWLFVVASCERGAPTKEDFDAAIAAARNT